MDEIHIGWSTIPVNKGDQVLMLGLDVVSEGAGGALVHSESESLGGGERKETRKKYGSTISCTWGELSTA